MAEASNQLVEIIVSEVAGAEADYQNARTRAISVAGISSGFVGLVSASIAISAGSNKLNFAPLPARITLYCALLSFVVAIIIALIINRPADIYALTAADLKENVKNDWDGDGWDRQRADYLTDRLADLRTDNESRSAWLKRAIRLEIIGIVLIALSALLILEHVPTNSQAPGTTIIIYKQKPPHRTTIVVPNVVGESEVEATSELLGSGFTVELVPVITALQDPGQIARQSPAGGSRAPADSVVTIDLSAAGNG